MGPCKHCGNWHCACEWIEELSAVRRQATKQIQEHRQRKARNDQSFQRFMAKVLHG